MGSPVVREARLGAIYPANVLRASNYCLSQHCFLASGPPDAFARETNLESAPRYLFTEKSGHVRHIRYR